MCKGEYIKIFILYVLRTLRKSFPCNYTTVRATTVREHLSTVDILIECQTYFSTHFTSKLDISAIDTNRTNT